MFEAVVFDMDGVIFDTERLYRRFELAEGAKYNLPEDRMITLCERIAGGTKETNRITFQEIMGDITDVDYYDFRAGMIEAMDSYTAEHGVDMKKGVQEFLDFLKERGIKIALATSTDQDRADRYLTDHNLYPYFDEIVFGNTVANGKPAPDIYLKACEKLGVNPKNAIGIEDSIKGVKSSFAAGLHTVMVVDMIQPNDEVRANTHDIFQVITETEKLFKN